LAAAIRYGQTETAGECRRDLRASKLETYIRETVAAAPPLTAEQLDKLSALLRVGTDG
jgi:hypothetical protein